MGVDEYVSGYACWARGILFRVATCGGIGSGCLVKLGLLAIAGVVVVLAAIGALTYLTFFQPKVYTVTIAKVGGGSVEFSPLGGYTTLLQVQGGSQVTVKATAAPGYVFSAWTGDYQGKDNPTTITVYSDIKIIAVFVQAP